jgi:FkbM family methyltransferase
MLIPFSVIHKKYDLKVKGILHLGAHMLEEKSDYEAFGVSDIVWIEGNPEIADAAKKLLPSDSTQKILNYLISDTDDEEVEFNIANNGQSSSILALAKHKIYSPNVYYTKTIVQKTKKLKSVLEINKIDYTKYNFLNIDLQGVELRALRGYEECLHYIDYVYTEVNSGNVYEGNDLIGDIDSYLADFGFERVETHFTGAEWGDAFYIKKSKRTQIVNHIMPNEIDEYSTIADKLKEASDYLEKKDWISIYATLNLSDKLIDWNNSELDKKFFIDKFQSIKQKFNWANEVIFEIIEDGSILGTTAQKRKAIKSDYDQFIFLDCDISFHKTTLKYILETSYQVDGKYFITPQTVKLWDWTWDILTHKDFENKDYGYEKIHNAELTNNQTIEDISVSISPNFKFGCGWMTLYSKDILNFIGIPEWLGHYGPEDTYLMYASEIAKSKRYEINQYVINGIYVSENFNSRDKTYYSKVKSFNLKDEFRNQAESQFTQQLKQFENNLNNR